MSRVTEHNKAMKKGAEYRAMEMTVWPSPLEERMKAFLKEHCIQFEEQKIFYIYADDGYILRYYIADFYIPDKKVIIEVDGRFHDDHKQHDKQRTKEIQEQYPGIEVLRYKWKDLSNEGMMNDLLSLLS